MQHDEDKVDEMTLALLYLNMCEERGVERAWKSLPVTEEGQRRAEELFKRHFGV